MKNFLFVILALAQVVYATNIHCANCAKKVQENIAFEKGVKDLEINMADKTVKVVYNTEKTDTVKLAKAINKLGYSAKVIDYKEIKK